MSSEPADQVSTEKLVLELENIREQLKRQAEVRHRLNNVLTATMGQFHIHTEQQDVRLAAVESALNSIRDAVEPLAGLVDGMKDIRVRLIGDPAMKSDGLVQQLEAAIVRVTAAELKAENNTNDIKRMRMERTITVTVLGSIGAIVAFLKSTAILKWLAGN